MHSVKKIYRLHESRCRLRDLEKLPTLKPSAGLSQHPSPRQAHDTAKLCSSRTAANRGDRASVRARRWPSRSSPGLCTESGLRRAPGTSLHPIYSQNCDSGAFGLISQGKEKESLPLLALRPDQFCPPFTTFQQHLQNNKDLKEIK